MVPYHPEEDTWFKASFINLTPGPHLFKWIFHQPLGTNRHKRIILSDIVVEGSNEGGATKIVQCERGTYSTSASPNLCQLCHPGTVSNIGSTSCTLCSGESYAENWGSVQCETCGNGTMSNENKTGCDYHGCVFRTYQNVVFNLSSLNYLVELTPHSLGPSYKLSLCDKLTQSAQCYDKYNQVINGSHVCTVDSSNGIGKSSGNILTAQFNLIKTVDQPDDEIPQLRLSYTHGSSCGLNGNLRQRTDIVFFCDPLQTGPTGPLLVTAQACVISFEWYHLAACRLCDDEIDYEKQYGDCVDGMQEEISVSVLRLSPFPS
jgi:hypothetical protein